MNNLHSQRRRRSIQTFKLVFMVAPAVFAISGADTPDDAVHWSAALSAPASVSPGGTATIDLSAVVGDGWHVYALQQHAGGPTPLHVVLDTNATAAAAGALTGTPAETVHDTHFGFDTQLYTHNFTVHLPIRVGQPLTPGRQLIPISVRFQACSDRECLLPRTIHLSVPVDVPAA
jgi:hypothetical protein